MVSHKILHLTTQHFQDHVTKEIAFTGPELRAYVQGLPVPPDYTGPPYNGPSSVNDAFVDNLLNMYKTQAKLPMKYAYLMALDVLDILKQEKSLQRVAVPPGSKIFVTEQLLEVLFGFFPFSRKLLTACFLKLQ